jgi:cysteine-rich repeat protein
MNKYRWPLGSLLLFALLMVGTQGFAAGPAPASSLAVVPTAANDAPAPPPLPAPLDSPCDCCVANPGGFTGCNDVACERVICAVDPFCCSVAWDSICAGEGSSLCTCCGGASICGDGFLVPPEQCDDGNTVSGDGCSSSCTSEGEPECDCCMVDPANETGCNDPACESAVCSVDPFCCSVAWDLICAGEASTMCACCGSSAFVCGDGVVEGSEECDDGNTDGCDGCAPYCANEICGNGTHNCGEECDDGNTVSGDGCSATCELETTTCGNGTVDAGEQCDDGNTNNNDNCTNACKNAQCGDGFVDQAAPGIEQCDDGNTSNTDNCTNACLNSKCGDGFVDQAAPGIEQCDDGNTSNTDNCTNTCLNSKCGDGFLDVAPPGVERCDDGNTSNTDNCTNTCLNSKCGDGFVDQAAPGIEQCDDGNTSDNDNCTSACVNSACGDGIVDQAAPGVEQCDDGNNTPGDGCTDCLVDGKNCDCCFTDPAGAPGCGDPACQSTVCSADPFCCSVAWDSICANEALTLCACCGPCGNGVIDPGEQCDDGNAVEGDGCSHCFIDGQSCDCCFADPGGATGCNDPACQNTVCSVDAFCCSVAWDSICAGEAFSLCACCQGGGSVCGNGVIESGEQCDDANTVSGDGCSGTCQTEICGNSILDPGEQCDPPTTTAPTCCIDHVGPGCSDAACQAKVCAIYPQCCSGDWTQLCSNYAAYEVCVVDCSGCRDDCTYCGDGIIQSYEQCDDGSTAPWDYCRSNCVDSANCGDCILQSPETCDPPNEHGCNCCTEHAAAGCFDLNCSGAVCAIDPSCCSTTWSAACVALASQRAECVPCCLGLCRYDCSWCGDGVLNVGELCDDGNQINGDGCDACQPPASSSAVPTSEDVDGDGTPNGADNCPLTYNPGNGTALFDQVLRAKNHETFVWTTPENVVWVCGPLVRLSAYSTMETVSAALTSSISAEETPSPGQGMYWLVRPDCPGASWSSGGPGEVPGRDGALP